MASASALSPESQNSSSSRFASKSASRAQNKWMKTDNGPGPTNISTTNINRNGGRRDTTRAVLPDRYVFVQTRFQKLALYGARRSGLHPFFIKKTCAPLSLSRKTEPMSWVQFQSSISAPDATLSLDRSSHHSSATFRCEKRAASF